MKFSPHIIFSLFLTPGLLEGQEDCLYINVYRPEEKEDEEEQDQSQELLPVSMISTKRKMTFFLLIQNI